MQATKLNLDRIRAAASGRWEFVVSTIARINPALLDGKHHPCPSGKCGSQKDAFRVFPDFEKSGGVVCNQCGKHADGFATLQWLTGRSFREVAELVASLLCIDSGKPTGQPADPAYHLRFFDWNESLAAVWCLNYKPIIPEAIKLAGGRMAVYRGKYTVLALPVWVANKANIVGWRIWNIRGKLPKFGKTKEDPIEWVKSKLTYGSQPGVVGTLGAKATEVWKVEGETDMLALLSANPRASVICNASGAGENPTKFNWLKEPLQKAGSVYILHDADNPGQDGAERWTKYLAAIVGPKCHVANVELPYPIQQTKGKDLRDWIGEGNRYETLLERAKKFLPTHAVSSLPEESEDDPHRLARVNAEQYEREYDGRLIYWRDEWWKYKTGCWRPIGVGELRAKVTAAIRKEFERGWRIRQEKGGDEASEKVRKVTKPLVSNVVGAMESMFSKSANIQMPVWLPDRKPKNYLSMANGLLSLDAFFADKELSECLLPHSPHWFSTFKLAYGFDQTAECPKWMDYLEFVTGGDESKKAILQEWAGYLLSNFGDEQKFLAFEGQGNNGKSSFFAGMEAMLGSENVSSLSLESFNETFALSTTIGKAANIAGDVGKIEGGEEAILKRYTGGEALQIRRMYLPPLTIRPTAKLMMAWNERPRFHDKSDGLWRRLILVPLNQTVPAGKRIKGMDRPSFWESEAPGIFLWALIGLERLNRQGDFSKCAASVEAIEEYKADSNPVVQFFADHLTESESGNIESGQLYTFYQHWCECEGYKPMSNRTFGKEVRKVFPKCDRVRFRSASSLLWRYEKICWCVDEVCGKKIAF